MNRKPIPYARQSISEADIQAVVDVLRSDWLTQGPVIERFEKAVAQYCSVSYAVAVNSGTSALHIACLAAGLGPGDSLWTTPNTFVASANCGLYCGASVDFVDIDPGTYNLSPEELERKLDHAAKNGTLPKLLVPVHFSGRSCAMDRIAELAGRYGITVIEDACHAAGGNFRGSRIGSCAFSAMTVFSFHPVKIITTGEGGMILTNRKDLYDKLIRLRSHGITRDTALMEGKSHGPWYYQQQDLGYNYRITDMQAALGISQMTRIDEFIRRRDVLASQYDVGLRTLPLTLPLQQIDSQSAHHLYVIRVPAISGKTRSHIFSSLLEAGILANVHYIPVHLQPLYHRQGFRAGDFPHAEQYYHEAISLPMYFGLTDEEQSYVIETLRKNLS
jgi:UDP-4-amino-4,6-dideoxy-N-acetyl-beta-L-altrosamine transaminase